MCFQELIIEAEHLIRHDMVFKIILQMDECWWVYSPIQGSYNQTLTLIMQTFLVGSLIYPQFFLLPSPM